MKLESLRSKQSAANEKNSQIQQDFYRIGGRISNLEQKIEHNSETRQRRGEEVDRLESGIKSGQHQIEHKSTKTRTVESTTRQCWSKSGTAK